MIRQIALAAAIMVAALVPRPALAQQDPGVTHQVKANNDLAFVLYRQLGKNPEANVTIAPHGLATILRMIMVGTQGDTRLEFERVLQVKAPRAQLSPIHKRLTDAMQPQADGPVTLAIKNDLWLDDGHTLVPAFVQTASENYSVGVHAADFDNAAATVEKINTVYNNVTRGMFPRVLEVGPFVDTKVMVMTNLLYFKAPWTTRFDPRQTTEMPFFRSKTDKVMLPTMRLQAPLYGGSTNDTLILIMPFAGNEYAMLLAMPKEPFTLPKIEEQLTSDLVGIWRSVVKPVTAQVELPKFDVTTNYQLSNDLRKMGLRHVFSDQVADIPWIVEGGGVYVNEVRQQVRVKVDEAGAEAAAGSMAELSFSEASEAPPPFAFKARQPFLYVIYHARTGQVLITGRMADPSTL